MQTPAAANRFTVAIATDVGTVRQRNEDAALVPGMILASPPRADWQGEVDCGAGAIAQVIDGMGGHGAGALAAQTAAMAMNQAALVEQAGGGSEPREEWAAGALQSAADLVTYVGTAPGASPSMGAATVGLTVGSGTVLVFHVGDCRCYVLESGYLSLLTEDHRAPSGALTRSLGGTGRHEQVAADVIDLDRSVPRRYLLCSDGVSDYLAFEQLQQQAQLADPSQAARGIVAAALAAGSQDNATVLIADVPAA